MRREPDILYVLAAALVAASLGIGTWKVVEIRRENERLALQARTCMARNEAFVTMLRLAKDDRGAETPSADGNRRPGTPSGAVP